MMYSILENIASGAISSDEGQISDINWSENTKKRQLVSPERPTKRMRFLPKPTNNLQKEFDLFLKTVTGRTIILNVRGDNTIAQIKQKICETEGFDIHKQTLVFAKQVLSDFMMIAVYGVKSESIVHLVVLEN